MKNYLELLRVKHWIKNLLIFAPLFFAVAVFRLESLVNSILVFASFSFASSAVYILNDIFDVASDRLHPQKRKRPIASLKVSLHQAYGLITFSILISFLILIFVPKVLPWVILYILLNFAYSFWIKHIEVLDIVLVSSFYILRIVVGGIAAEVYVSPWIILCVFFGSLFVITGKRRAEFGRESRRKVLDGYSEKALDFMLFSTVSLAIMSYGIWSVIGHNSPYLVYSVIFVLFALFKLINRIYTHPEEAESPELLVFKDKWILLSFAGWIVYTFLVFYVL